jgi:hypothetical protein
MQDIVIVGEVEAGEAAKVRGALTKAIRQVNVSTFDIIELVHKVQSKRMYTTATFYEYLKTLDFKVQKLKYLARIGEFMEQAEISRAEAENIGVTKMRAISRLDPATTYTNPVTNEAVPMIEYINALLAAAPTTTSDKLEENIRILKGEVGENDMTWLNIRVSRLTKTNVIDVAFSKAATNIGDIGTDKDGIAIKPSDARKLEIICVAYNLDPNEEAQ